MKNSIHKNKPTQLEFSSTPPRLFRRPGCSKGIMTSPARWFSLLALALLFGPLSLFAAAQAQARGTPPIWSATLTLHTDPPRNHGRGCGDLFFGAQGRCDSALTDNSFSVGGNNFSFVRLYQANNNRNTLWIKFNRAPNNALKALNLCVGTTALSLQQKFSTDHDKAFFYPGFTWSAVDTVELSIGSDCSYVPTPPTGGTPTGGGPPPAVPSDPDPPSSRCGETDREDLVRFYEASGGVNWHENGNWNSTEPLDQWHGVEKIDEDENVISLSLLDNNLSGDMPTEELLCLTELVELALWGNKLLGEIPDELTPAVERAVLRDVAEALSLNAEWFEDYENSDFGNWHEGGVTTDDDGRVTELDFTGEEITGEIPRAFLSFKGSGK